MPAIAEDSERRHREELLRRGERRCRPLQLQALLASRLPRHPAPQLQDRLPRHLLHVPPTHRKPFSIRYSSYDLRTLSSTLTPDHALRIIWVLHANAGFEVATRGCCGTGEIEVSYLCNSVDLLMCIHDDKYVFWDSFHPTEKAYQIVMDQLLSDTMNKFFWRTTRKKCVTLSCTIDWLRLEFIGMKARVV